MVLVKSIKSLELIFWNTLMELLGADKNAQTPMVRRSWNKDGAPDWGINDNVLFMQLTDESMDDISQPIDGILTDKGDDYLLTEGMTRVLTLSLIAYGPQSYENLLKLQFALGRGYKALRAEKIYPLPAPRSIQRAPELFQGRWWERADVKIRFNCLIVKETDINRITNVPVTIKANSPGNSTIVYVDSVNVQKG